MLLRGCSWFDKLATNGKLNPTLDVPKQKRLQKEPRSSTQQKNLVHLWRQLHCAGTFVVAFAGNGVFMQLCRWLFVGLTSAQLGEEGPFFSSAAERRSAASKGSFSRSLTIMCFLRFSAPYVLSLRFGAFLLSSRVI